MNEAPRPPEELVDALQESIHSETGIVRAAKSVRVPEADPRRRRMAELTNADLTLLLELSSAAERLWVIVANASGGDWSKQSQEWQDAAARARDNYFVVDAKMLSRLPMPPPLTEATDG